MSLIQYNDVLKKLSMIIPNRHFEIKDITVLNLLKILDCSFYSQIYHHLYISFLDFCKKHQLNINVLKRFLRLSKKSLYLKSSYNTIKSITNYTKYKKAILIEFILNKPGEFNIGHSHFSSLFSTINIDKKCFCVHPLNNDDSILKILKLKQKIFV